jgi:hypothetical protein
MILLDQIAHAVEMRTKDDDMTRSPNCTNDKINRIISKVTDERATSRSNFGEIVNHYFDINLIIQ